MTSQKSRDFPDRVFLKHVSKMDGECSVFKFLLRGVDGKYFLMRWVHSNSSGEVRTEPDSVVTTNLFFLISWLGQRYSSVLLKPPRLAVVVRAFLVGPKGKFYLELLTSIQGKLLIHLSIQARLSLETSAVQMCHYGEFRAFGSECRYGVHKL